MDTSNLQQQDFLLLGPSYKNPRVRWIAKKLPNNKWVIHLVSTENELTETWRPFSHHLNSVEDYTWEQLVALTHKISPLPEDVFQELFVNKL